MLKVATTRQPLRSFLGISLPAGVDVMSPCFQSPLSNARVQTDPLPFFKLAFPAALAHRKQPCLALPSSFFAFETPRLYLDAKEAAQHLRVSRRQVAKLAQSRQLTFTRVRRALRFRLQWLNEYLDRRTVKA